MVLYAGFFLIDINDKVLIIRYSHGKNKGLYGGPGGHIEKYDKNLKATAIRELKEETNIDYCNLEILNEKSWTYNKKIKLFVVRIKSFPKITLSDEHDNYKKIKFNNLNNYPLTETFKYTLEINLKLNKKNG